MLRIDSVRYHCYLLGRESLVLDQEPAVRCRDCDKGVGNRRQHAVEATDAIGPARAVQSRHNHTHTRAPGSQSAPKHLVAGANGHHGVDRSSAQQANETRQDAQVEFI